MWFAAAQALRSPTFLAGTLFLALGRPRLSLTVSLAELGSLALAVLVLQGPLAWAARLLIVVPVLWLLLQRRFGISLRALLRGVSAPFAAALGMGALLQAGLPWLAASPLAPLSTLVLGSVAGALGYAVAYALFSALPALRTPARELAIPHGELP
jgi:hypothetical protein